MGKLKNAQCVMLFGVVVVFLQQKIQRILPVTGAFALVCGLFTDAKFGGDSPRVSVEAAKLLAVEIPGISLNF